MNSLREKYQKEIFSALQGEFHLKNKFQVPSIDRVMVNFGIGKLITQNPQRKDQTLKEAGEIIAKITGQKPKITVAKKSVAGFKLREGMPVGLMVTLRKVKAYDFLGRLIGAALPRSRDFQGLSRKSVGPHGSFDIGLKEHIAFPEVANVPTSHIYGMQITIVPTRTARNIAMRLYELLGFPFRD